MPRDRFPGIYVGVTDIGAASSEPGSFDDRTGDDARLRGWRRRFVTVYGVMTVVVVVAVVVGAAVGAHRHPGRAVHWWVVAVIALVAVLVVGGGGVLAWRLQSRRGRTRRLLLAGTWRSNRRVGIELRKGRQIAPADRRAAQAVVDLYAHRRWLTWLYAALGVFWLAISFGYHGFQLVLHIALGVLYLALTPYWAILRRRTLENGARQGLHPTGDQGPPTP